MADDQLADFLKRQATRSAPPTSMPRSAPHRMVITRLHLPFGDVFRLKLQVTMASALIGIGLGFVTFLLLIGLHWLPR